VDLHPPGADLVSDRLRAERTWEPFESRVWLAAQRPGDVVLDVGANLGYFSLLSACYEQEPEQVFAFEPAADNFELLLRNLQHNDCVGRVHAVRAALGDSHGELNLYRNEENRGDHQIYPGDGQRLTESVPILRGADYLRTHIERVDLLKVDTQGSELAVLAGLWPLLTDSRDTLRILLELTPYSLGLAGASGRELVEGLAELDLPMAIVDHLDHRLVASDGEALATWCDNVAAVPDDRGFMNIFVGEPPDLLP